MGSLSKKYESGSSGPGTVANNRGDIGGASYGTYQIATNTGTMKSFMNYLKSAEPGIYERLAPYSPGSSSFNNIWKSIAKTNGKRFDSLQHGFIKQNHYEPARKSVEKSTGLKFSKYSQAVNDVLWSTAVQHGAGGASRVFRNAGVSPGMTDAEIIKRVYNERMAGGGTSYFPSSSASIRSSVVRRFKNEMNDALRMLG